MAYALFPLLKEHVRKFIEPPVDSSRYVLLESSFSGLSRYLVADSERDVVDELTGLEERLPPSIAPAISSNVARSRSPQKLLNMLSEGRRVVSSNILKSVRAIQLRNVPAYEFIAHRLLSEVPDPDDVLRFMAAAEDRKAVDQEGFERVEPILERVYYVYLSAFLASFSSRRTEDLKKILSSHVRPKAIENAKVVDARKDPFKNRKAVMKILHHAYGHIRERREELKNYTRGSKPAAFLVFVRDHLTVAYVYEIMDLLGQQGYDVREIIVGYDSSSQDIAERVSKTLEHLGHVRSKAILIPQTPGGIIKEFLGWLVDRYDKRGMRLFIDGWGGSPATFVAVLRNFRDRLVLVDRRFFFVFQALYSHDPLRSGHV